ncbi:MAG: hypothetical protein FJ104_08835 [Deltaproteobacteria bacterium]|nr:hypothetical protein [Deltaproteobacteria bacterium]
MTKRLEEAFAAASRLPDDQQDSVAEAILQELADESRWTQSFATSQDLLGRMADDALAEHRAGRTKPWPA